MNPCQRCGGDHPARPYCDRPKRTFKPGQRIRGRMNGRPGVVLGSPRWLDAGTCYVEWTDGLTPRFSRAFPGWLEKED